MPAVTGVTVYGLKELQQDATLAGRQAGVLVRGELRGAARPIADDAQSLAMSEIPRMPHSPEWSKMRVGVTQTLVYVAPRQRGVKRKGDDWRRRPNLADLMMDRAMEPALERHEADTEKRVEAAIDHIIEIIDGGPGG